MELIKEVVGRKKSFKMEGRFTAADTLIFRDVIKSIENGETDEIVLDMGSVDYVDSAALGMFLIAREQSEKNKVKIKIINVKDQPEKAFSVSKFDTLFDLE